MARRKAVPSPGRPPIAVAIIPTILEITCRKSFLRVNVCVGESVRQTDIKDYREMKKEGERDVEIENERKNESNKSGRLAGHQVNCGSTTRRR